MCHPSRPCYNKTYYKNESNNCSAAAQVALLVHHWQHEESSQEIWCPCMLTGWERQMHDSVSMKFNSIGSALSPKKKKKKMVAGSEQVKSKYSFWDVRSISLYFYFTYTIPMTPVILQTEPSFCQLQVLANSHVIV